MVLLNMQWLANFRTLKHCAMVISTAYYGWGAKDTVSQVTSFLGINVTRTTRDSFFKRLTSNRVESFCLLLMSRRSGLMVWDNFQRGQNQKLREQRGGKYIMDRVKSMKHNLMSASIPDEQENVEESEWVSYMQELRLDYYN